MSTSYSIRKIFRLWSVSNQMKGVTKYVLGIMGLYKNFEFVDLVRLSQFLGEILAVWQWLLPSGLEWHISWQENRKQEIDDQEISCRKLETRKTGKTRKNKGVKKSRFGAKKRSTFCHFLQIIDNFYHFLSSSAWIKSYTVIFMTVSNLNKHLQFFLLFGYNRA